MFSFIGYTSCDLTVVHPTDNAKTKINQHVLLISISSLKWGDDELRPTVLTAKPGGILLFYFPANCYKL